MRFLMPALSVALLAVPSFALSDPGGQAAALDAMRSSASYQEAVMETYQTYETTLSTNCDEVEISKKQPPKILKALELNAKGEIVSGEWQEREEGKACGQRRRFNALVIVRDGKPMVAPEFPGDSYASPELQRDSIARVNLAVNAGAGCRAEVLDTRVAGTAPSAGADGRMPAWQEKWSVRSCGDDYVVTMHFMPDGEGTAVRASPDETVKK